MSHTIPSHTPPLIITPPKSWQPIQIGELWRYRELLWFLALRDIMIRYKQSLLGAAWAVVPPLMQMLLFGTLFALLMGRTPTIPGIPYSISAFTALVPWYFFANSLSQAGTSVVRNRRLITKVYFPRLLAPSASVVAALVDFVIAFGVLIVMITICHFTTQEPNYRFVFTWRLAALPGLVLLTLTSALGVSLLLSALNAIYRDVVLIIPVLVQLLMYTTPVVYSAQSIDFVGALANRQQFLTVGPYLITLWHLNPMYSVVEGFRWAILGSSAPLWDLMFASVCLTLLLLICGLFYFRHMEKTFADLV